MRNASSHLPGFHYDIALEVDRRRRRTTEWWRTAEVVNVSDGPLGLRSRHWLEVDLGTPSQETWLTHFELTTANNGNADEDPKSFQIWGFNNPADPSTWSLLADSNQSGTYDLDGYRIDASASFGELLLRKSLL